MVEPPQSKRKLPFGWSLLSYRVQPIYLPQWPVADVRFGVDMAMIPWTIAPENEFLPHLLWPHFGLLGVIAIGPKIRG